MVSRVGFGVVCAALLWGCSGSGNGGGGAAGGGSGGISGLLEQPNCTPGTFGVSGRIYFPDDAEIHTTLFPLAAVAASTSSLSATLSPDGAIDLSWKSGAEGDSVSGSFRVPTNAGAGKDWCVDDSSKIVVNGSAATLKLYVFAGPCPLPPDSGVAPPKPAVMDMLGCVDSGP